jgi:hypothetical protein
MESRRFRQLLLNRDSLSLLAIVLLADALLLILAALDYYPKIVNVDGLYSAQVANNLLSGKGYSTNEMTLYEVNLYFQKGWLQLGPPWLNSGRFPLPVLIRAALFLVVGDNYLLATYLYSMSFQLISVAAVFVVSLYMFREKLTAFFGSLFFAASPIILFSGINGKETTSDYVLFLLIIGLVYSWRKQTRPKLSRIFILGLVLGLTYLNRFNLGGVLLLSLIPLVIHDALSKRVPLSRLFRMILTFAGGFALMIAPLAIYNSYAFGNPIFSSNALFQFVQFTRPVKYMNPWWKLSYPFDTTNSLSALNMFSGDIISRIQSTMIGTFNDFLSIGGPGTGYSWFWWIPIAFSAIVGLWPRLTKGTSFPYATNAQSKAQNLIWYFVIFNLIADLPILGIFSAGVEYVWYLYSALAILAGFGLTRIIRLTQQQTPPSIVGQLKVGEKWNRLSRGMTNHRIGLAIFVSILMATVSSLGQLPSFPTLNQPQLQLAALATGTISALLLFRYRRAILPAVLILLMLAVPIVRYGIVGSNGSPEIVPSWITDQDPGMLQLVSSLTSQNAVVLSAEPWNIAWWSHRVSVAFSEFPDETYLMMAYYKVNVQAVYIADLNSVFFRDISAPYTYEGYRRMAFYNYSMGGFDPIKQGFSDGEPSILLLRNNSIDPSIFLNTRTIDFGNRSDSSHLVWGWSQVTDYNGTAGAWAYRPGGLPLNQDPRFGILHCLEGFEPVAGRCLPLVTFTASGKSSFAGYPDAEVTFLSNSSSSRSLQLRVLSPISNQTVSVVLNPNLVYFGQPGVFLGNYTIPTEGTWLDLSIALPQGAINTGLNMLSLVFSQAGTCPSPGPSGQCTLLVNNLTIS